MDGPGGRRGRGRGERHGPLRALRRAEAGVGLRVRRAGAGSGGADRAGGLGPGADPYAPPAPADRGQAAAGARPGNRSGNRSGAAGVAARAARGPWHPATHLALLHAGPGFTVIVVGLVFGVVAARDDPDLGRLALAAGLASLGFGLALNPATFALAVAGLACAWAYDLRLKGTVASVLPFAVALPLVPLFGYGAAGRFPAALWWAWPIGALAAVAVHLADSLPDVERDQAAGVRGLATRLGVRRAARLTAVSYAAALAMALGSGLAAGDRWTVVAGSALAAVSGVAALLVGVRGGEAQRRVAYRLLQVGVIAMAAGWAAGVRP